LCPELSFEARFEADLRPQLLRLDVSKLRQALND
jgi:hypothetical protein